MIKPAFISVFCFSFASTASQSLFCRVCHADGIDKASLLWQGGPKCHTYSWVCSFIPTAVINHPSAQFNWKLIDTGSFVSNPPYTSLKWAQLNYKLWKITWPLWLKVKTGSSHNDNYYNYSILLHTETSPHPFLTHRHKDSHGPQSWVRLKMSDPLDNSSTTVLTH